MYMILETTGLPDVAGNSPVEQVDFLLRVIKCNVNKTVIEHHKWRKATRIKGHFGVSRLLFCTLKL